MSNIKIVNVSILCTGGKGMIVPATMTEPTKTVRSTNKAQVKLIGVNLVIHQFCDYRQYQQG